MLNLTEYRQSILDQQQVIQAISVNSSNLESQVTPASLTNFIFYKLDDRLKFLSNCFISEDTFFSTFIDSTIVPNLNDQSTLKFNELIEFTSGLSELDRISINDLVKEDFRSLKTLEYAATKLISDRGTDSASLISLVAQYIDRIADFSLVLFKFA